MNVNESAGPDLLPADLDIKRLEPKAAELFLSAVEALDTDLQRTAYWSLRLMMAFDAREAVRTIPGFMLPAFGFLDPELEEDAFGVILLALAPAGRDRLPTFEYRSALAIDDHRFPIAVRFIEPRLNAYDPPGGTTACVATSRNGLHGPGYLTAKHVVGRVGAKLTLSCGCAGSVVDVGPEGIDVALIESNCASIPGPSIRPKMLVPPWLDVQSAGSSSGTWHTKVSAVSDTRGVLTSEYLPVRVFLAQAGRGGDSGALVTAAHDGEPVGIYLGELADPSGRREGVAQHCYQAASLLNLELYQ